MILPIFWLLALMSLASSDPVSKISIPTPSKGAFPFSKQSGRSSFIVELRHDASLGKRSHDEFHKRAVNLNLDYQIQREFTNPSLFYGLSIKLNQNVTLSQVNETLKSIPEVVAVYPNRLVSKPAPIQSEGKLEVSTAIKTNPAINQTWTPADSSSNLPHITGIDTASVLKMADVDKVHALGIKGKGMKIGIIDSGVDYTHPSLGGGFGPGFKVAGGYAFVDDNWYPRAVPISSPDPLTTCFEGGHGTHVSGMLPEMAYVSSLMLSRNCRNGRPSQCRLWVDWSGPRSFSLHVQNFQLCFRRHNIRYYHGCYDASGR